MKADSNLFEKLRRVVIKIGTNVLTTENNRLDTSIIEHIVEQISYLVEKKKKEVIIVTSGAIAAGMQILGWEKRPKKLNLLQAAASVGQSRLMRTYERLFREEGLNVGQILLTRDVFVNIERKKYARDTLLTLLKYKVIPIINENDSVAVEEIKFGDNDILSSYVVDLVDADILVILCDVDGLYTEDPKKNKGVLIREVKDFNEIEKIVKIGSPSEKGVGGIKSKIQAAKFVISKGKLCVIINGKKNWVLKNLFEGKFEGTIFYPSEKEKGK
ncbi:MAG: glutamate 5-kinase [Candidatus Omnitrophica bacterium]|nr:glutamate 5-kinase [Candidatus Omnitrophota bacterium]MCM8806858.1 glutamate 5-kinase [Candidatus Omnitrophota bacterium]